VKAIHEVYKGSSSLYPPIAAKLIDYAIRAGLQQMRGSSSPTGMSTTRRVP
jgi:hypothetical protein